MAKRYRTSYSRKSDVAGTATILATGIGALFAIFAAEKINQQQQLIDIEKEKLKQQKGE